MTGTVDGISLVAGRGSFAQLPLLCSAERMLVVASRGTLQRTGLDRWLPAGTGLFTEFRPNPTVDQAVSAACAREAADAGLVLGIGGGSALDVAKAARALPADPAAADEVIAGRRPLRCAGTRLVLVPTTAGTGSEVTRFATFYRGDRKVSLDADDVRADTVVIDPGLTESCPPELTWSCAFDALAHAVESLWSRRSTGLSRRYAEAALERLVPILRDAGEMPNAEERDLLSDAGTLAGKAIDVTRTTAAHALAYPLTVHLGIPHGLACALNLTWLAPMVEQAADESIVDERGPGAVRAATETLRRLLDREGDGLGETIRTLLARRGMPTDCAADPRLAEDIVRDGLSSNRMSGTPISLAPDRVRASIVELLGGCRA